MGRKWVIHPQLDTCPAAEQDSLDLRKSAVEPPRCSERRPGCEDAEFLAPDSHLAQVHLPRCHTSLNKPPAQTPACPCCGHKRGGFLCRVFPTPATCFRPVGRWSRGGRDPCSTSARPGPAIDQRGHASSSAPISVFPGLIYPPWKRGGSPPAMALLTPKDLNLRLLMATLPLQRVERADN